jgi:hypothetical protein
MITYLWSSSPQFSHRIVTCGTKAGQDLNSKFTIHDQDLMGRKYIASQYSKSTARECVRTWNFGRNDVQLYLWSPARTEHVGA